MQGGDLPWVVVSGAGLPPGAGAQTVLCEESGADCVSVQVHGPSHGILVAGRASAAGPDHPKPTSPQVDANVGKLADPVTPKVAPVALPEVWYPDACGWEQPCGWRRAGTRDWLGPWELPPRARSAHAACAACAACQARVCERRRGPIHRAGACEKGEAGQADAHQDQARQRLAGVRMAGTAVVA